MGPKCSTCKLLKQAAPLSDLNGLFYRLLYETTMLVESGVGGYGNSVVYKTNKGTFTAR